LGIVDNIQSALDTWNRYLGEIWNLLSTSPQDFRGGGIWDVIREVNGSLQAIGYALLVLFFVIGLVKHTTSLSEIKRPEVALRFFLRFAIAKAVITYGMDIMVGVFDISQGVIRAIVGNIGAPTPATVPQEIVDAVGSLGILDKVGVWAVSLIGSLVIIVLSIIMLYTVYARFIRLYIYTAISPIPLSTFAGQGVSQTGAAFLKSYAAVCLEGAVIVLACIIFSAFASAPPMVDPGATASQMVWAYIGQLAFNLLVLTGSVKLANMTIREMLGL
jgi:hypothetical protein